LSCGTEARLGQHLLDGLRNPLRRGVGRDPNARTVRHNPRGIVRLVAQDCDTDQRHTVRQRFRQRPQSALRNHRRHMGQ